MPASNSSSDDSNGGRVLQRRVTQPSSASRRLCIVRPGSDSNSPLVNRRGQVICVSSSDDEGQDVALYRPPSSSGQGSAGSGVLVTTPVQVVRPLVDVSERSLLNKMGLERQQRSALNHYEHRGTDLDRIRSALQGTCCAKKCIQKITFDAATRVCFLWHCYLTSSERRSFIHVQVHDGCIGQVAYARYALCGPATGEGCKLKNAFHGKSYKILHTQCMCSCSPPRSCSGAPSCRPAVEKVLGIHPRFLSEAARGKLDGREAIPGAPAVRRAPQSEKVHEFLLGLYKSAAEPLPHEKYMVRGSVDNNIQVDEEFRKGSGVPGSDESSGVPGSDDEAEIWNPDASVVPSFASFLGQDVGVQRRYLTHTTLTSLYWLMLATMEEESEEKVPSFVCFFRVWQSTWHRYLGFRKTSQHAECKACFAYREQMHQKEVPVVERMNFAREWRLHLRAAYHDRLIYWWCRYASRHSMDVLTVIIDSMDKAKFAWPQYPWGRKDKALEGLRRPRLVVTGAIAHGYCTHVYVADERLSHGASAFCDVLARVLESVRSICKATGRAFPRHLVVQSDNTTAQAKNTYVAMFLAFLVAKYKFSTTNLFFLPVGHTHEDIGFQ